MNKKTPHPDTLRAEKVRLRRILRATRAALPQETRHQAAQGVAAQLGIWLGEQAYLPTQKLVAGYVPAGAELDPLPALTLLTSLGWRTGFPHVGADDAPLTFSYAPVAGAHDGPKNRFGITEPDGETVAASTFPLVLLPGVAFTRSGVRLGQGGGFYDRTFTGNGAQTLVGVCFDEQIVTTLPLEPHDLTVDVVITPSRILLPGTPNLARR